LLDAFEDEDDFTNNGLLAKQRKLQEGQKDVQKEGSDDI
jgi:hypothetical protein